MADPASWVAWIVSDDPPTTAAWAAEISRLGGQAIVVPGASFEKDDLPPPNIVIAKSPGEANEHFLDLDALADDVGLLRVGFVAATAIQSPQRVSLPADATPREVALAAALLAQLVQLQGQLRRGRRQQKKLKQLALCDPLTGLANRWAWEQELARRCAAAGPEREFVVAILDVDHFKSINDHAGHAAGDQALRAVAANLEASLRDTDFVARIGGDEFGILLSNLPRDRAAEVVERIRRDAAAAITSPTFSASAGWTWIDSPTSPAAAFHRADQALLHAKSSGRARVCDAEPGASATGV